MARPDIGFTLEHDGRRNIAVQPGESRELRVAALTDRELADHHVMVALEREGVTVSGVAAITTYHRGVADHQFLYVYGRPVHDRFLVGSLRVASATFQPRDRHPVVDPFVD